MVLDHLALTRRSAGFSVSKIGGQAPTSPPMMLTSSGWKRGSATAPASRNGSAKASTAPGSTTCPRPMQASTRSGPGRAAGRRHVGDAANPHRTHRPRRRRADADRHPSPSAPRHPRTAHLPRPRTCAAPATPTATTRLGPHPTASAPGADLTSTTCPTTKDPDSPTARSATPARPPPERRSTTRIALDPHKITALLAVLGLTSL